MIDDASVGPGAVLGEESKRCVPVEELEILAGAGGRNEEGITVTAGVIPLACISAIKSS